jgi:hypothetical protein
MSALCQKRTHALQQNCVLINSEAELAIRNHGSVCGGMLYVATRNQAKALAACLELQGLE